MGSFSSDNTFVCAIVKLVSMFGTMGVRWAMALYTSLSADLR